MSKALTHETHYRARTGSHSTKGSKRGVNLLGWESAEWLSADQERAALVLRAQQLAEFFTSGAGGSSKEERRALGREQAAICERIRQIRPRIKSLTKGKDMQSYMVEALKAHVPKHLWRACYEEALKRCSADAAENGGVPIIGIAPDTDAD